jgi:flagellar L-ring protein precursor FlgH
MRLSLLALVVALVLPDVAFGQSMFADPTARSVGDPITIVLSERTSASSQNRYEDRSNGSLGGSATTSEGGSFAVDASVSSDAEAASAAVQSDLLTGTITAVVTGVDDTGNLQITGERVLHVNGVTHLMKVAGTVRPLDVRYDNTILSYQIANAEVEYRKKGLRPKFLSPGTLLKAAAAALVGAAVFLGTQ